MAEKICAAAVDAATYAIDKLYSYRVPDELREQVQIGTRVLVPFGFGNKRAEAVVLAFRENAGEFKLKPIVEVLEQAERPIKRGAIVMDTAGYDISSVTSMVAAGCQAVIFTTGRGTPTGNAIVPVLKVTANRRTFEKMEDNMDIDLSPIVSGEKTYQEMGREMVGTIRDICNGKMTKAEAFGFSDIAVDHVCRFV